jgi:glyoxylase-like metal-dependent hydrolase (beta-lactamase superfamily II)
MPPRIVFPSLSVEPLSHGALQGVRIGPVDVVFGEQGGKYPDGNHVTVRGTESRAGFDMPIVSREVPAAARACDIVVLGHVHEDHTAGLDLLPHVPVHVHAGDVDALRSLEGLARHYGYSEAVTHAVCRSAVERYHYRPRADALAYDDGDATWELGRVRVRAVHAPGHTSGHCVLLVEPHGIAFIGDIDLSGFGPYYGDATSSLEAFRATLRRLADMRAQCWITSHHKGVVTDRVAFLRLLAAYESVLDKRDAALVHAVRQAPRSLDDLVRMRFLYRPTVTEIYADDAERRTIAQHLDALVSQGAIQRHGDLYSS